MALLLVTVWGVNFVAIRWGVDEVPPLLLSALRSALAAVPAIFFIRPPKVPLGTPLSYGVVFGALQFGLLFAAARDGRGRRRDRRALFDLASSRTTAPALFTRSMASSRWSGRTAAAMRRSARMCGISGPGLV